jgi:ketosteroid isomerase-like protein
MALDAARLADRVQISELLSRYCSIVDDKRISADLVAATFTPDGRYVLPNDMALVGPEAIATHLIKTFNTFSHFRATHHVTSDHIIEFDGDTARLRANMTAMHLWSAEKSDPASLQTHFLAGGVFEALAVRIADGWRFSELSTRIVWRTGAGLPLMAMMDKPSG